MPGALLVWAAWHGMWDELPKTSHFSCVIASTEESKLKRAMSVSGLLLPRFGSMQSQSSKCKVKKSTPSQGVAT